MAIWVVVDSTACLTAEQIEKWGNVAVVSLTVSLGDDSWRDGELPLPALFERIAASGMMAKTSQPSPAEFERVLQPILAQGDEALVLVIDGELSGTVQGAQAAAARLGARRIRVVDSRTTAAGLAQLAEAALADIADGCDLDETERRARERAARTRIVFTPSTLSYLHKGGRIGGAAALFGALLQIKPVLYLEAGKVAVLDKVRTRERSLRRVAEAVAADKPVLATVVEIEAPEDAAKLRDMLAEAIPGLAIDIASGGSVLGAHLGPGLVGVTYLLAPQA